MALKPLYCDNAATTFPKPRSVCEAMVDFMTVVGASPGRSTHVLAIKASRMIFDVREKLASFFGVRDSSRVVFCANATEALNTALLGLLKPNDRVAVTAMEHNSVMRPLSFLARNRGVKVIVASCDESGVLNMEHFERIVKSGVKLVAVNHGSNVSGALMPLEAMGEIARAHGAIFLVDAAQTAGVVPIDVEAMNIDLLAFSGHKSLYGPMGTGGLFIRKGISVEPLKYGGTGSNSDSDDQPGFYPDVFESGTLNGPGIAGLGAGIDFVLEQGLSVIHDHGVKLAERFIDKISALGDAAIIGPPARKFMLPTVSIVLRSMDQGIAARRLSDEFGICVRMGLHCAPNAHRALGTFPQGTIRFSFGFFNTEEEVDFIANALKTVLFTSS